MYSITEELKSNGFSMTRLDSIIKNSNDKRVFNTLEYFCIVIVMEDISLTVEKITYDIKAGNMVFLGPQKNIGFGEIAGQNTFLISFSASFYERSVKDSLFLNSRLFFNYGSDIFMAPFSNREQMKVVFIDRMESFRRKDQSLYISAAHNAIERLMLDAFLYIPSEEAEKEIKFDYLYGVNRFKILLQKDYKKAKTVAYYANELCITSRKLTEMTEFVLGKPAKQVIVEKLVSESTKLLRYSNYTISQIAFEIGFTNEANFTNFIKKNTGRTPSEVH